MQTAPSSPSYPAWGPPSYLPSPDYNRSRMIDRTKSGLMLLIVGSLLGWIPVISIIGGLLALIGAILVILGRDAFGSAHSRNVLIAVTLYIVGLIIVVVLALAFASSVRTAVNLPSSEAPSALTAAFAGLLEGAIVAGIFTGLASVLFLYGLLNTTGKVLIWASFFLSLLLAAFVYSAIMNQLAVALPAMYATNPPNVQPITALDSQIQALRVLNALPGLLAAAAAYVALRRINNGEIPARSPWGTPPASGPYRPPH